VIGEILYIFLSQRLLDVLSTSSSI
jgi:hypothetical protein